MEVQQLVRIARRGGAQKGQEGRQERRAAARAQVRAAGVSAEESGIYVSFPGCQVSASWCTWGRTSSWRPAGDCWTPLSFYAASGAAARAVPKRTKSSAMVQLGTAVMAAQSAWPGALWHAWEWRIDGCGRAQGRGLGVRYARSPAALPTWPPMVAEWSGVAGVHLVAPARLLERPRAEI